MARLDYFAPGVYVEEVERGSRPIQGISLSVAGFVGFTEDVRGDAEVFEPTLVTSWQQYLDNFASIGSDGIAEFRHNGEKVYPYLPFAVKGWFDNGGGRCWVVSIGKGLPLPNTTAIEEDTVPPALTPVRTSGNRPSLEMRLKPDKESMGRFRVLVEPDSPIPDPESEEDPFDTGEYFKIKVLYGGEVVEGEEEPHQFRHLTMDPAATGQPAGGHFVETALASSEYLDIELTAEEGLPLARRPANGTYEVRPRDIPLHTQRWYQNTYGNQARRSGVTGLFEVDDVAMVACPDLMFAYQHGFLDLEQVHGLMEMMITRCENAAPSPAYRMAVLDPPPVRPRRGNDPARPEQQKPQDVEAWLMDSFGRRSQFAALYYPWLKVPNPKQAGKALTVPPCGHMMGIWCRTDETRGIYKAPANEIPKGIVGLAYDTNFREQELLNPKGINCIRKFRNRGTLVWGARTLAQLDDINWRYISVRRLMSYIEKSIEEGTQWAVFEPNDEDLWARVTRTVKNFLERIWRQGALFGSTPEEAFFVKCDSELNTPETMKLGLLYVDVGVSPVRPAEFVVFRISQWDPTQDQG